MGAVDQTREIKPGTISFSNADIHKILELHTDE